jgi:hypothetical protein
MTADVFYDLDVLSSNKRVEKEGFESFPSLPLIPSSSSCSVSNTFIEWKSRAARNKDVYCSTLTVLDPRRKRSLESTRGQTREGEREGVWNLCLVHTHPSSSLTFSVVTSSSCDPHSLCFSSSNEQEIHSDDHFCLRMEMKESPRVWFLRRNFCFPSISWSISLSWEATWQNGTQYFLRYCCRGKTSYIKGDRSSCFIRCFQLDWNTTTLFSLVSPYLSLETLIDKLNPISRRKKNLSCSVWG